MHIQLITFNLHGISDADLRAGAQGIAPHFAAQPGLRSKIWLADRDTNTYGGVYAWESRTAMEAYLDSDLFATAVRDNAAFAGLRSVDFDVLAEPTRITGPERLAASRA
jgi:quinol monooxygenase YgiN